MHPTIVVPVLVALGSGTPRAWRAALRVWLEKSKPGMVRRSSRALDQAEEAKPAIMILFSDSQLRKAVWGKLKGGDELLWWSGKAVLGCLLVYCMGDRLRQSCCVVVSRVCLAALAGTRGRELKSCKVKACARARKLLSHSPRNIQ